MRSPKFFRKITYVDTLSELASYVPLTQIDVPPAVYQFVLVSIGRRPILTLLQRELEA